MVNHEHPGLELTGERRRTGVVGFVAGGPSTEFLPPADTNSRVRTDTEASAPPVNGTPRTRVSRTPRLAPPAS